MKFAIVIGVAQMVLQYIFVDRYRYVGYVGYAGYSYVYIYMDIHAYIHTCCVFVYMLTHTVIVTGHVQVLRHS